MAYIIGLLSRAEAEELEQRGWRLEDPPKDLEPESALGDGESFRMVWVDSSMFEVMSGPDWEKAPSSPGEGPLFKGQLGQ